MKLRLLTLLLLFATTASAQRIGIEAGVNFANQTLSYDDPFLGDERESGDERTGLKLGVVLDYQLEPGFYFQPGLYYSQKGFEDFGGIDEVRIDYLELPLNLLFKAGNSRTGRFFAGGGPYLGFALGGEGELQNGRDFDVNVGEDIDDEVDFIDAGLNLTVGYELPMGVFFRANAALGLANVAPDDLVDNVPVDDYRVRNRVFAFTIGYFFR